MAACVGPCAVHRKGAGDNKRRSSGLVPQRVVDANIEGLQIELLRRAEDAPCREVAGRGIVHLRGVQAKLKGYNLPGQVAGRCPRRLFRPQGHITHQAPEVGLERLVRRARRLGRLTAVPQTVLRKDRLVVGKGRRKSASLLALAEA